MRLIDADFFKLQFKLDTVIGKTMHNMIDEQPTIYDADTVVRCVNGIGKKYCDSVECNKNCDNCEHGCMMWAIINTIKSGCVS